MIPVAELAEVHVGHAGLPFSENYVTANSGLPWIGSTLA